MKILMVASESRPFCKTGGLADVVYSLSKELASLGEDVSIILPYYDAISRQLPKSGLKKAASFKDENFSLSGMENLALKMIADGENREDVAKFVIDYIANTLEKSAFALKEKYGVLPLFFAGGVMSNSIISKRLSESLNAYFSEPEYSSDNASGVAIYGYLKWRA